MKYTENITMETIQPTFLLLIFCLLGCTSTHRLRPGHRADYVSLNKRAVGKQANVTFIDGRKIKVENLRMTADSTYWDGANKIATDQIREVRLGEGRRRTGRCNDWHHLRRHNWRSESPPRRVQN